MSEIFDAAYRLNLIAYQRNNCENRNTVDLQLIQNFQIKDKKNTPVEFYKLIALD